MLGKKRTVQLKTSIKIKSKAKIIKVEHRNIIDTI